MSTKIQCYLRTLRREWGLTQAEVAFLVGRGDRNRVSGVERGEARPNAGEILAYELIFGSPPRAIFPTYHEQLEEALVRRAYKLHQRLEKDPSKEAQRKRKLLEKILARATGKANGAGI